MDVHILYTLKKATQPCCLYELEPYKFILCPGQMVARDTEGRRNQRKGKSLLYILQYYSLNKYL